LVAPRARAERPELYRTLYTTQVELWELDDAQWRKIMPRPYERREPPTDTGARQLALPIVGIVGLAAVLVGRCVHYGSSGCKRALFA